MVRKAEDVAFAALGPCVDESEGWQAQRWLWLVDVTGAVLAVNHDVVGEGVSGTGHQGQVDKCVTHGVCLVVGVVLVMIVEAVIAVVSWWLI